MHSALTAAAHLSALARAQLALGRSFRGVSHHIAFDLCVLVTSVATQEAGLLASPTQDAPQSLCQTQQPQMRDERVATPWSSCEDVTSAKGNQM